MRADSEIRAGLGILLAIQLVATFGVMGLLVRMNPAIEQMVHDDLPMLGATQELTVVLAEDACGNGLDGTRFDAALDRASAVATDPTEAALLDQVRAQKGDAMTGDCTARGQIIGNVVDLSDTNRTAMRRANASARQLAIAGAWATALLGVISFFVSLLLLRRWLRRFAEPLREIEAVLQANANGDPYRRNRRLEGPNELGVIASRVNHLLDRRIAREEGRDPALRNVDRALLMHLLDRMPEPVVAVDTSGAILAASRTALDRIGASKGQSVADALKIGPEGPDSDVSMIAHVEPFGSHDGFLVTLHRMEGGEEGPGVSLLDDPLPTPGGGSLEGSHTSDLPPEVNRRQTGVPEEWK